MLVRGLWTLAIALLNHNNNHHHHHYHHWELARCPLQRNSGAVQYGVKNKKLTITCSRTAAFYNLRSDGTSEYRVGVWRPHGERKTACSRVQGQSPWSRVEGEAPLSWMLFCICTNWVGQFVLKCFAEQKKIVGRLRHGTLVLLYPLVSGGWLAWANGTTAHYAAIHCPR